MHNATHEPKTGSKNEKGIKIKVNKVILNYKIGILATNVI